jgi:sterol desaturase/sphingolipid hydroxylase (fatty acid hydroxylase superfamily)
MLAKDFLPILYVIYVILLYFFIELFSYIWHRFTHTNTVESIKSIHQMHHSDFYKEADEDFIVLILLFLLFEIAAVFLVQLQVIPALISFVTVLFSGLFIFMNWYVHRSYHDEKSFLNNYHWFRVEKERHLVHHKYTNNNFGITSHIFDKAFGTWKEAE